MKVRHMYLSKKYRLRRGLLAVGIVTLAFVAGIAFCSFTEVLSRGLVEQLDGQAQWAVEASAVRVVENE